MILYQFPISHYCEKSRWALDFKGISYSTVNLAPGLHLLTTKNLAKRTTVPILVNNKTIVQDSTHIIDYLDSIFPNKVLTPRNTELSLKSLEWEEYFDEKVGPHLRRYFYFHILPNTKLAKSLILSQSKPTASFLYFFIFPAVRFLMKKSMNISQQSAERSKKILNEAIDKLNNQLVKGSSRYLVGDEFSRADLTAASLLAPICLPPESPFLWPPISSMPDEIIKFHQDKSKEPFFNWVLQIYKNHR